MRSSAIDIEGFASAGSTSTLAEFFDKAAPSFDGAAGLAASFVGLAAASLGLEALGLEEEPKAFAARADEAELEAAAFGGGGGGAAGAFFGAFFGRSVAAEHLTAAQRLSSRQLAPLLSLL